MELKEGVAVQFDNKKDMIEYLEECERQGYRWASGDLPTRYDIDPHYYHANQCCIIIKDKKLYISSFLFLTNRGKEIVKYKDLIKEKKRMKNIDLIKDMTVDELVELINSPSCDRCVYENLPCNHSMCKDGILEWLEQDVGGTPTVQSIVSEFNEEYEDDSTLYNLEISLVKSIINKYNIVDGKIERR